MDIYLCLYKFSLIEWLIRMLFFTKRCVLGPLNCANLYVGARESIIYFLYHVT